MRSRMYQRKEKNKEKTPHSLNRIDSGMLQRCPETMQLKTLSQQPDLKTSFNRAERYGHHLSRKEPKTLQENIGIGQEPIQRTKIDPAKEDWRKTKDQLFYGVGELKRQEKSMPELIQRVTKMTIGIEGTKLVQYRDIQKICNESIELYKELSDEEKIKNSSRQKGTEAYLRAKLDGLASRDKPKEQKSKEQIEWEDFEQRVHSGWEAFEASNWNPSKRGVNNGREYKRPKSVVERMRNTGGTLVIRGGTYKISDSHTTNVSLHRAMPSSAPKDKGFESYVFHL